ncbi:QueT transporter family protein [Aerococcus sanguinicola]|uniref:Citrulline cluster-linked protein n=1 Tax=Aerococcus sanguinicola TaxID=119206 RepID=A0A109RDJ8_9LACT|nr:QueT transporter family protein [Aerococcus sanguinicola]AMB93774.1 citrulline cluster-linked protein [Aerococcus sanguinicola]
MQKNTHGASSARTLDLTKAAIIAALYVAMSLLLAPLTFGPIGIRLSEGLNFLGLYHKRYIYAITVGVFIVNYFSYGIWDMIVGSISTFIFLWVGRWLGEQLVKHSNFKIDPMIIKYIVLTIVFSLSMFTITFSVVFLGFDGPIWPLYLNMAGTEALAMIVGGFIIYPISKRINFYD